MTFLKERWHENNFSSNLSIPSDSEVIQLYMQNELHGIGKQEEYRQNLSRMDLSLLASS